MVSESLLVEVARQLVNLIKIVTNLVSGNDVSQVTKESIMAEIDKIKDSVAEAEANEAERLKNIKKNP
jgi:hypothetical protein